MTRRTAWANVLMGAVVMIVGFGFADDARQKAQKVSVGILKVRSVGEGRFMTWQLATLTIVLGGVVAASGTGAGIRHGFYAGLLAAVGAIGLDASRGEPGPVAEYWLSTLSMSGASNLAAYMAVSSGIMLLAVAGGWLGGALLLPVAPQYKRSARSRAMD